MSHLPLKITTESKTSYRHSCDKLLINDGCSLHGNAIYPLFLDALGTQNTQ